jgi:general secretion pathway protein G
MMQQIRRTMRQEEGFTLIELLIVIVILGILAAIVVFAVNGITDRGTSAACKSDLSSVQVASEAYYAQNGTYAADASGKAPALVQSGSNQGFLKSWPTSGSYTITYAGGGTTTPPSITGTC